MKALYTFLSLFLSLQLFATEIGGVINQYTKVVADGGCRNSVKVSNPELFGVGEEVIIIQMQGAVIDESNTAAFGTVTDLNNTGNFERAQILEIVEDTVYFYFDLVKSYDFTSKVQLVSLPVYSNIVDITSTLTCAPWNGETGGVLAFSSIGTTSFTDSIDVSGKGFRGGNQHENPGNACSWLLASPDYYYPNTSWEAASKGEGIALPITGKEFGKGPSANGGGGGNDHNSGGAGGANGGTGGKGAENDDPGLFTCIGFDPGIGGIALPYSSNVAFMGGGGGAGHGNNDLSSGGANGGGIVIFIGNDITGPNQVINAKGANAAMTGGGDGAGAGGAGGTVLLDVTNTSTFLKVNVNGGNGGDVDDESYNRCHGPGGGGAGGVVRSSNSLSSVELNLNGGNAGLILNSTAACNNTNGGALNGNTGLSQENLTFPKGETEIECLITSSANISSNHIKVFPNPTGSAFNIQFTEQIESLEIYNTSGQLVKSIINQTSFGEDLPAGVYCLKVISNQGYQSVRVIKQK